MGDWKLIKGLLALLFLIAIGAGLYNLFTSPIALVVVAAIGASIFWLWQRSTKRKAHPWD